MLAVPAVIAALSGARTVHFRLRRAAPLTLRCWWLRAAQASSRSFKVGGAQAVAAMAYGTATIPKCDKVFGPGNAYVTAAKLAVAADPEGAAADLPAGVTEVMVIAGCDGARRFRCGRLTGSGRTQHRCASVTGDHVVSVGASRGERDLTPDAHFLSRADILAQSVANIRLLIVDTLPEAFAIANRYAPEHLLIEVEHAREWLGHVTAAGAVFLGSWSPESMGDYCSGPNHTLPTYGYARAYSGLSLEDFQKRITVQELTPAGLRCLGRTAQVLAGLEGLDAHAASVSIRLDALARADQSA